MPLRMCTPSSSRFSASISARCLRTDSGGRPRAIVQRLRMVADAEVLEAEFLAGQGHFFRLAAPSL